LNDLYRHRWISVLWQNNQLTLFENERLTEKIELDIEYFANTNALPTVLEMVLHGMGMGVALLPELVLKQAITNERPLGCCRHIRDANGHFI